MRVGRLMLALSLHPVPEYVAAARQGRPPRSSWCPPVRQDAAGYVQGPLYYGPGQSFIGTLNHQFDWTRRGVVSFRCQQRSPLAAAAV